MLSIAIGQLNTTVGAIEANGSSILGAIHKAAEQQADAILFPELAITGYPPLDNLHYTSQLEKIQHVELAIQRASDLLNICVIVGTIVPNQSSGKQWYNAALLCRPKQQAQYYFKQLLPTYDVFDESRHFEAGNSPFLQFDLKGKRIAISICEDVWCEQSDLYHKHPVAEAYHSSPFDLLLNLSASPYHNGHESDRILALSNASKLGDFPIVYANQVGVNTDLVFEGRSGVFYSRFWTYRSAAFQEEISICYPLTDFAELANTQIELENLYESLILGIKDFFQKSKFQSAILGLSGGIDSALVAALATQALGKENVFGVLLPSEFSSQHSISDAEQLAKNLGIQAHIHPITDSYRAMHNGFPEQFHAKGFNVAEENLQSRIRGTILMAYSNKFGHVLLNTTNKSEMAVGYGTLYGDMNGGISVLGDIYKTEVYQLAKYINRNAEIIPWNSIEKAPSAELRPDQKDSDSLPDYEELDAILSLLIEEKEGVETIIKQGYDPQTVEKIAHLLHANEFKRFQAPPVIRVRKLAFGDGRRMPLVGKRVF